MNTRPFVVEFTGTPEAGKTTTIKNVIPIITEKLNCKVDFVQESAELVPSTLKKGSYEANLWMSEKTITSLLKSYNDTSNHLIIVDRGCVDIHFFRHKFYKEGLCSKEQYEDFLRLSCRQDILPDLCIILKTTPEESIRRRGGEGRIVTLEWVKSYNKILKDFLTRFQASFTSTCFVTLDTTNLSKSDVIEIISDNIITSYQKNKCST